MKHKRQLLSPLLLIFLCKLAPVFFFFYSLVSLSLISFSALPSQLPFLLRAANLVVFFLLFFDTCRMFRALKWQMNKKKRENRRVSVTERCRVSSWKLLNLPANSRAGHEAAANRCHYSVTKHNYNSERDATEISSKQLDQMLIFPFFSKSFHHKKVLQNDSLRPTSILNPGNQKN